MAVHDGQLLQSLDPGSLVRSIAFSPDGMILAAGTDPDMNDNSIWMWEVCEGRLLRTLNSVSQVESIAFNPDGTILASGSVDGKFRLWQVRDGQLLQEHNVNLLYEVGNDEDGYPLYDSGESLAFSPDGSILAVGGDNFVRIYRVRDGRLLQDGKNIVSGTGFAFSPYWALLASTGDHGTVQLWEVQI